jgi:hypothetical protein
LPAKTAMPFPRIFATIALIAVFLLVAKAGAQNAPPPPPLQPTPLGAELEQELFDVSVGFNYLRADDALAKNMYGFDASLFLNINSWLALGGEFIGGWGRENHLVFRRNTTFDESRTVYVAGARIKLWQRDNFKVFGEALAGGAHGRVSALIFGVDRHASADGFAAVLGAGAEWKFTRRLSWRMAEVAYVPAKFNGQWENNWCASTGIVYSFGSGW